MSFIDHLPNHSAISRKGYNEECPTKIEKNSLFFRTVPSGVPKVYLPDSVLGDYGLYNRFSRATAFPYKGEETNSLILLADDTAMKEYIQSTWLVKNNFYRFRYDGGASFGSQPLFDELEVEDGVFEAPVVAVSEENDIQGDSVMIEIEKPFWISEELELTSNVFKETQEEVPA